MAAKGKGVPKGMGMSAMPSKSQMAAEERHYRAESMARQAMENMPAYKKACKVAEQGMMKTERMVKQAMMKKGQ